MKDVELQTLVQQEQYRQQYGINLIASENYASKEIMDITGSVLCNKYVEGYPSIRYYSGCAVYDQIELLAIDRFKKIFKAEHVNVQPHSGSQANAAVYLAVLKPGNTILSMDLAAGGHLSHGHKVNWTHQFYNIVSYGVHPVSLLLDYDEIERLALLHKPKLIIVGASAYSRTIDFERCAAIAAQVGALLMADVAHIAGLIAADLHPSPFPHADIVTMTTHKTFRGPRGGVIMSKKQLGKSLDKMLMPGMQGGALMNHVAGKATAALEAMQPSFVTYQKQVISNAQVMAQMFMSLGYKVLTGGTDNHLFLIDVLPTGMNGRQVEQVLESVDIFINRNAIPFDTQPPLHPSGIRIGTPAITTFGADEKDVCIIVSLIDRAIKNYDRQEILQDIKKEVHHFMIHLHQK
ncbi:serine hydroxymethyltransferase [Candidatus Chromulinivorax destructor]|uniref:Serine hydroxymethyltransferase n=1 Tax=Candidatus Chromulinivorax destructor TaxID=2066483 RepID=A0A345ZBR8_9BACT|nr:serine hydroxymethyltransferase [Candidatus Chromulinivorax destructor]